MGVLVTGHGRLAVVRGYALLDEGTVFCDEVVAAVDDTCRNPIMLMRSSGFADLPLGRGCRGDMSRICWFNVATRPISVLVTGHGR